MRLIIGSIRLGLYWCLEFGSLIRIAFRIFFNSSTTDTGTVLHYIALYGPCIALDIALYGTLYGGKTPSYARGACLTSG